MSINLLALTLVLALEIPALAVPTDETPEKETLRLSKFLKPIPDDEWKQIAGEQFTGKYEITKGDTLSGVSKRLFGDPKYWPKIWAMNNDTILNPHLIRPKNQIAFQPGSGTSLPSVAIVADNSSTVNESTTENPEVAADAPVKTAPVVRKNRSREWKDLPNQPWDRPVPTIIQIEEPAPIPMGGFEKLYKTPPPDDLPAFASARPVDALGHISSSPAQVEFFRLNDLAFIDGGDQLHSGETYTILSSPPFELVSSRKHRTGYAYRPLGEVQIIGQEKNLWLGKFTQLLGFVRRGDQLVPRLPPVPAMAAIPGPSEQEGTFFLDNAQNIRFVGENQVGYVNLGSEDGIQPGMVFETYETIDGQTEEDLPVKDLFRVADMQAIQVTEEFSTVKIISGTNEVRNKTPVHLMTDVTRFRKYGAFSTTNSAITPESAPKMEQQNWDTILTNPNPKAVPSAAPEALPSTQPGNGANELDPYDTEDKLNPNEQKELQQLEKYKATTPEVEPTAPPPPVTKEAAPDTVPVEDEMSAPPPENAPAPKPQSSKPNAPKPKDEETLPPSEPQLVD